MLLFCLQVNVDDSRLTSSNSWCREGDTTMRASTFATLVAALGLTVAGVAAALAGEYRGPLDSVNANNNTLSVMGVTIQANGYLIANLDPTQSYVVSWEKQGGQNVLLNI